MTDASVLLADQVFQLNALLWALQELPDRGQIRPILREAGYGLGAIGRRLLMPEDELTIAALWKLTGSGHRSPCRPDIWLRHESDTVRPLIELKAHGFSTESSNRRQALKFIAAAVDLAPSLAESIEVSGHVTYATVASDANEMASTLRHLSGELRAESVATASTGVIGLATTSEGVSISSPICAELPTPLANALEDEPMVLLKDGDNDLQPLYFVPWIPGGDATQDPDLRADGLRELTARVLAQLQTEVGRTQPPITLRLDATQLLRHATFGIFDMWQDQDRGQFTRSVARIVSKALSSVVTIRSAAAGGQEIEMPNEDAKKAVLERLSNADPANPSTNLQAEIDHPQLFEDP